MVQVLLRTVFVVSLLALSACRSLFFYPERELLLTPATLHLPYEALTFSTPDGELLHSWLLKAPKAPRATILFLHGNAENISTHIHSVAWLPQRGFDVLLLEYRGFGASSGAPSVEGCIIDAETALRYLKTHAPQPVIVFGQSIGGAIALAALAKSDFQEKIAAIITEGAFASYREIAQDKLAASWITWLLQPLAWFVADSESPRDLIGTLSIPKLIIHGTDDPIIPESHARELFAAAAEPKSLLIIPGSGHIESTRNENVRGDFLAFIEKSLSKR